MKNYSLNKILLSAGQLFVIGLLSLTVACKDEPARLTGDVLPEGEMIKGHNFDGHILSTQNIARESVRTSDATYGIIGEFNDPVFGESKAAFLTDFSIGNQVAFKIDYIDAAGEEQDTVLYQFNNTNTDAFPNDEWKVDSLMLNLSYQFNAWYGDMMHEQNVNIYELTSPLGSITQEFYSDHDVDGMYNATPISQMLVHPNNEVPEQYRSSRWDSEELFWEYPDSVWNAPGYLWEVDSAYVADGGKGHQQTVKHWGFKLNDDLANTFFDFTEEQLTSTSAFKNEFYGVYVALDDVTPGDEEGWLTKINLLSGSSVATNISIHLSRSHKYINSSDETRDTVSNYTYQFPINLENVRFNTYKHNLSSDIKIDDPSTEKLYIQGMAGSYMQMQLPDEILNWVDSIGNPNEPEQFSDLDYRMVANIEFFMELAMDSADIAHYPVPERLTMKWQNEDGELVDPIYSIVVNGNKVSVPVFGTTNSQGNSVGSGERVPRLNENGDIEYLYRFIMRADYFNYIMRHEDGADLNDKVFFIGPENPTANFQRVILYSGSEANEQVEKDAENIDKRMKMNIKYYQYRPR